MTDDEIEMLIMDLESDRVERKAALSDTDRVCEAFWLSERRRGADLPFDVRPVRGATGAELMLTRFKESVLPQLVAPDVIEANNRTVTEQLAASRFTDMDGIPTPTGLLVCGLDAQRWLPGAWIQFLRVEGTSLDGPIVSQHRIGGFLPEAVLELEEVLRAHIDTRVVITGGPVERRQPSVPFEALQQVVRNAVMHRQYEGTSAPVRVTWFDDRIEVQSPGGPFGTVHEENFGRPGVTDYRNPTLATTLAQMGIVQRFGVGIQVARRSMERNGNPPLRFQVERTYVNAVLPVVLP